MHDAVNPQTIGLDTVDKAAEFPCLSRAMIRKLIRQGRMSAAVHPLVQPAYPSFDQASGEDLSGAANRSSRWPMGEIIMRASTGGSRESTSITSNARNTRSDVVVDLG